MGLQINQYPIERSSVGADDFLDIDYWDGSQYRTAKIKASNLAKLEKLLDVSQTPIDLSDSNAKALVKGDDGLWRSVTPLDFFNSFFQSGIKDTMPNIVNHNFDIVSVKTDGNFTNLYGYSWPYTKIGNQTFGEPMRMNDVGSAYIQLWSNPNSNFVEIDNVILSGFNTDEYIYGNQFVISAPNLVSMVNLQPNYLFYKLNAPNLKYLGRLNVGNSNNVFDFPSLEFICEVSLYQQPSVLNLPSLKYVQSLYCNGWNSSTPPSFPSLKVCQGLQFSNCYGLTSVDFPSLEYVGQQISISYNPSLTTINLSNLRVCMAYYISFQDNALTQQAVDDILVALANMDGQSAQYPHYFGYAQIYLQGGSNSAPSAVGLNAISILQSRNVGVVTN